MTKIKTKFTLDVCLSAVGILFQSMYSNVYIIVLNGHYGVYLGPCRRIFQNFHFYPFFWVKNSQKWPKNDIFALSAGAFFSEANYRHVYGFKWYLWFMSRGMFEGFHFFAFLALFGGVEGVKN